MNAFNEWRDLHESAVAATETLFAENGVHPRYAGVVPANRTHWEPVVSVVRFNGPELHGSMLLSVPAHALIQTNPFPVDPDPYDWLAELANLLFGSVKRALLVRGAPSDVSTPTTPSLLGAQLTEFSDRSMILGFEIQNEMIYVAFDGEWSRNDTKSEHSCHGDGGEPLQRGDVVFF